MIPRTCSDGYFSIEIQSGPSPSSNASSAPLSQFYTRSADHTFPPYEGAPVQNHAFSSSTLNEFTAEMVPASSMHQSVLPLSRNVNNAADALMALRASFPSRSEETSTLSWAKELDLEVERLSHLLDIPAEIPPVLSNVEPSFQGLDGTYDSLDYFSNVDIVSTAPITGALDSPAGSSFVITSPKHSYPHMQPMEVYSQSSPWSQISMENLPDTPSVENQLSSGQSSLADDARLILQEGLAGQYCSLAESEEPTEPEESREPKESTKARKRFPCLDCGRAFTRKYNLDVHMVTHSPPDPLFRCEHCSQQFRRNPDLVRHMSNVHNRQELVCIICGGLFSRRDAYVRHLHHSSKPCGLIITGRGFAISDIISGRIQRSEIGTEKEIKEWFTVLKGMRTPSPQ